MGLSNLGFNGLASRDGHSVMFALSCWGISSIHRYLVRSLGELRKGARDDFPMVIFRSFGTTVPPTQISSHHQDYSIFRIGNPELNLHL